MRSLVGSTPALFRHLSLPAMPESFRGAIPNDRLYDLEYDMWVLSDSDGATVRIGETPLLPILH